MNPLIIANLLFAGTFGLASGLLFWLSSITFMGGLVCGGLALRFLVLAVTEWIDPTL